MRGKHFKQSGFTLAELLVVIATVGILSATSMITAREFMVRAYRAVQKADHRNLRLALEEGANFSDQYGVDDFNFGGGGNVTTVYSGRLAKGGDPWNPGIVPGFRPSINIIIGGNFHSGCAVGDPCTRFSVFSVHWKTCELLSQSWSGDGIYTENRTTSVACRGSSEDDAGEAAASVAVISGPFTKTTKTTTTTTTTAKPR